MEIKKIKKLLLGLVIVTFAAGCGSDDDDPKKQDDPEKLTEQLINGQIRVGLKDNYTAIAPINAGLVEDEKNNITLKVASAALSQFYFVDYNDKKEAIAQEVSGKKLKVTLSVKGFGTTAGNDDIVLYAFTDLNEDSTDSNVLDGSVIGLETTGKVGIKFQLASTTANTAIAAKLAVNAALSDSSAMSSKWNLTAAGGVLKNVVITVGKGDASNTDKAPGADDANLAKQPSLVLLNDKSSGDDKADLSDVTEGSSTVELLSTEKRLNNAAITTDNTGVNLENGAVKKTDCTTATDSGQISGLNTNQGIANDKHRYAHFGAATCSAVGNWDEVIAAGIDSDDDKNVNVGFTLKGGVVVEAIKVEEVKASE